MMSKTLAALLATTILTGPALATTETPIRVGDTTWAEGVNTHFSFQGSLYDTQYTGVMNKLVQLGVHHIRDNPIDVGTYATTLRTRYRQLATNGVFLQLILSTTGQWASVDSLNVGASPQPVTRLEPINEFDNNCGGNCATWPADLRNFVITLRNNLNADVNTSSLPLYAPGFANTRDSPAAYKGAFTSDNPWDYVQNGGTGNGHFYSGGGTIYPESAGNAGWGINFTTANGLQQTNVSNQAVNAITEDGWRYDVGVPGQTGVTEACGGKYGLRKFMQWISTRHVGNNIPPYYWYQLIETSGTEDYGMLRQDLTQRPIYKSIANFNAILADANRSFTPTAWDFTLGGTVTNLHHQLLQDGLGYNWLVLWKGVQSCSDNLTNKTVAPSSVTVTFNTAPHPVDVSLYDPSVGTAATATWHNAGGLASVTVSVPDKVVLLKWHK